MALAASPVAVIREFQVAERRAHASCRIVGEYNGEHPRARVMMEVPANFSRYERIAPFYDLLDLPFEYTLTLGVLGRKAMGVYDASA
jgi:hypothetical protein